MASDALKIDTPEQVALELPIAGIGSRFMALAIDTVVQVVLYLLAALLSLVPAATLGPVFAGGSTLGPALLILLIFCLYWGYFAAFEALWKGQTPGKRAAGIRVIKEDGRAVDPLSAILRNLLRVIDFLPGLYAAGVVCMVLNRHSRRLGDLAAGTVVVHDRGLAETTMGWSVQPRRAAPIAQAAGLTEAEIVLIETYLARRLDLGPAAQDRAAWQIAGRLKSRLGVQPAAGQNVDDFLEAIARQARDAGSFRRGG